MDVEKLVRDALDEPAPPPPPEPVEDQGGGDDFHSCPMPLLVVMPDGSLTAHRWGTALLVWCVAGSMAAVYLALSWLWAALTIPTVLLALQVSCALGGLWLFCALAVGAVQHIWLRWRGSR